MIYSIKKRTIYRIILSWMNRTILYSVYENPFIQSWGGRSFPAIWVYWLFFHLICVLYLTIHLCLCLYFVFSLSCFCFWIHGLQILSEIQFWFKVQLCRKYMVCCFFVLFCFSTRHHLLLPYSGLIKVIFKTWVS